MVERTAREIDELKDQVHMRARAMVGAAQDTPACFEFEVFPRTKMEASEMETRVTEPRRVDVWSGLSTSTTSPFAIVWNFYTPGYQLMNLE